MKQDYFKSYKFFKLIQLSVLVVFAISFFCILYFDKTIKSNIFTNKGILTICVFLWAFMIYSLIAIVWDFRQLEGNILHDSALHRAAYVDNLTGIPNRFSCDQIFQKYCSGTDISKVGSVLVIISNLSEINKSLGRKEGNLILCNFSHIFENVGKKYGFVGRNGGNEFLCVIEEADKEIMDKFISDLSASLDNYNKDNSQKIEVSTYFILNEKANIKEFTELVATLYEESKRGI